MGSFSIWHLLILLAIALLVFGTKRLTSGAKDLGSAVKEFKKAIQDDSDSKKTDPVQPAIDARPPSPPADVTRVERPPPANPPGGNPPT